jgi:cysteine desulfurase
MHGGGHERGFRSGTLNVPGIVGLGAAAELCRTSMASETAHWRRLRDQLERGIEAAGGVSLNGDPVNRLPHVANLSFAGISGEKLVAALSDIALSAGSACNTASIETSHVLRAMGVSAELARQSLRLSLGRRTTEEDIAYVIDRIVNVVSELREQPAPVAI